MNTFRMPNTDIDATLIAYGCMKCGGSWDPKVTLSHSQRLKALRSIRGALDEGINFFDHADIYCAGKSEEAFSIIWKEVPNLRQKIYIQSKCGIRFKGDPRSDAPARYDFSYENIISAVEGSLRRLQTDYLDILLLHRPDPLVEPEEVARAFSELHRAGKVRYFGVSNHTAAQMSLLSKYLEQPIVANQVEISLLHHTLFSEGMVFNQDEPKNDQRGADTIEYCRMNQITLQAWGPLGGGRLMDASTPLGAAVKRQAMIDGTNPEAIALAWIMRHPAKVQPIIGTVQPERIRDACKAVNISISREEWYTLLEAARGAPAP